jgi:hypothetical protein
MENEGTKQKGANRATTLSHQMHGDGTPTNKTPRKINTSGVGMRGIIS